MQDIVQDALENAEEEAREMDASMDDDDEFGEPRIVIVGAGGAGNNTINRLYNIGVDGADTVAINTDKQHLKMIEADTKILVGKSLTNEPAPAAALDGRARDRDGPRNDQGGPRRWTSCS